MYYYVISCKSVISVSLCVFNSSKTLISPYVSVWAVNFTSTVMSLQVLAGDSVSPKLEVAMSEYLTTCHKCEPFIGSTGNVY
mgnify:CR=1 FL=1